MEFLIWVDNRKIKKQNQYLSKCIAKAYSSLNSNLVRDIMQLYRIFSFLSSDWLLRVGLFHVSNMSLLRNGNADRFGALYRQVLFSLYMFRWLRYAFQVAKSVYDSRNISGTWLNPISDMSCEAKSGLVMCKQGWEILLMFFMLTILALRRFAVSALLMFLRRLV